jgi:hypothetical protein
MPQTLREKLQHIVSVSNHMLTVDRPCWKMHAAKISRVASQALSQHDAEQAKLKEIDDQPDKFKMVKLTEVYSE